jgi:hypothetical protein
MWIIVLAAIGAVPIAAIVLAFYASAILARPMSERRDRVASFSAAEKSTPESSEVRDVQYVDHVPRESQRERGHQLQPSSEENDRPEHTLTGH